MKEYLSYQFSDTAEFIDTFDEAPLWSAVFGLLMLKHLELKPGITVADIGSGAGFPLLELAGRLGSSSKLYGVDPWKNANERARKKIRNYGITNTEILESSAENIPLPDATVDLVVSNLGINNFENPSIVFKECKRILKKGGRLALTTNVDGHWKEFYAVFEKTLEQLGMSEALEKLKSQQRHRGTIQSISNLFTENGFKVNVVHQDSFNMNFANGSAFLNHYFVKLGWLSSWLEIIPEEKREAVFGSLEMQLNEFADNNGGLKLSVPMAYIEGESL